MTNKNRPQKTYDQVFEEYLGDLKNVAITGFPRPCRCGYQIMNITDLWKHVRQTHKQKIIKKHKET